MARTIAGAKAALAAFKEGQGAGVLKFDITGNESKKKASIINGLVTFSYYESLLQDSIRASVTFVDSGGAVDGKTIMAGLPIYGSELTSIKIEDNNNETLELNMYVNKPDDLVDDTTKSIAVLNFASKEFLMNEKVRLSTRFDGLISDHVEAILTKHQGENGGKEQQYLNTEKEIDIEPTLNKRNFCGNNWKPFYAINWLCKQGVPSAEGNPEATGGGNTNSAGYMFWETADGFNFRSIDSLMNTETNKPKKKYIYNETTDMGGCEIPEGYDAKALTMSIDKRTDVQQKYNMGAYSTRMWTFNPLNCEVNFEYPNAFSSSIGSEEYLKMAGKNLPSLNEEFDTDVDFSRSNFLVLDTGTLPLGPGSGENSEQIKESKKENSKPRDTLSQGIMRMNQLFSLKVSITIPGDFSLRAGDAVYFDAPGLTMDPKEQIEDQQIGGNYVIGSLCHYIDGSNTLTKLDLVRDSFGRKPKQRNNATSQRNNATSRTGSFQDRRNWRRSSSAAARANTNRVGQNIKTSSNASTTNWAARRRARHGR